jgi:hypothetical protein
VGRARGQAAGGDLEKAGEGKEGNEVKRLVISLVLLSGIVAAQTPAAQAPTSQYMTGGSRNGRFWLRLESNERACLVIGFIEGAAVGGKDVGAGATVGELERGVDSFYGEPANAAIPISSAILLFGLKVRGESPEFIEQQTLALRRAAAGIEPKK